MSEGARYSGKGSKRKLIDDTNERIFCYKKREFSNYIAKIIILLAIFLPCSFYVNTVAPMATLGFLTIHVIFYRINPSQPKTFNIVLIIYWVVGYFSHIEYHMALMKEKEGFYPDTS